MYLKLIFTAIIGFTLVQFSFAQEMVGETHPDTGVSSYTYTVTTQNQLLNPAWTIVKGTKLSSGNTGTTYWVNVQFTSTGAGSVTLKAGLTTISSLPVTVVAPPAAPTLDPGAPVYNCGNTVVSACTTCSHTGVTWYWQTSSTGTDVSNSNPTYSTTTGTVYLRAKINNYNNWSVPQSGTNVTVYTMPSAGTIAAPAYPFYNFASGSLTLIGSTGTVSKWQRRPSGGTWTDIAGTSGLTTYNFSGVDENTDFQAVVTNGPCTAYSTSATVLVNQQNFEGTISGTTKLIGTTNSGSLQLNSYSGTIIQWEYSDDNQNWYTVASSGSPTLSISNLSQTRYYHVKVTKKNTTSYSPIYMVSWYPAIPANISVSNYVMADAIRMESTSANYTGTISQKTTTYSYFDGLGRTVQSVTKSSSQSQKDIVGFTKYDALGRQTKSYLPYTATGNNFYTTPLTDQANFYNGTSKVAIDSYPFAETIFDDTPLQRVKEQGAPGADFQPNHTDPTLSHTNRVLVRSNAASEIRIWKTDGTSPGYYAAGTLAVKELTDANGNKVITFTDKLGRLLQKRVQVDATNWLTTLYIYETWGTLKYTLQPEGVKQLGAATTISSTLLTQYAFKYTYDAVGRLAEKLVPGSAPVYFAYDTLGRLTLAQDGNLRPLNKWMFVKYDMQNRPVMQGLYTNAALTSQPAAQNFLNTIYASNNATYPPGSSYETRGTVLHDYTNQSFPKINADNTAIEPLAVSYYDTYDFNGSAYTTYAAQGLTGVNPQGQVVNEGAQGSALGMPTGSKRLILGTTNWLFNYVFYDKYGRVIQTRSSNHLNPTAIDNLSTIVYDFIGNVLTTKSYHNAGGANQYTVIQKNIYDFAGRLTQVFHNINNAPIDQLVAQYEYNELGQVVDKKLHNTTGTNFLQSVDYRYNIQGKLTSINNAQLTNDALINDDTNDYFGMELLYNTADAGLGNTVQYNGNISAMKWKNGGVASGVADQRSYKFSYDKSDKLLNATFQANTGSAWTKEANTLNENMTYDFNGNILTLLRNQNNASAAQTVDNLTYTYIGNQLNKVEDGALSAGFNNGKVNGTDEYTYSATGSLTKDDNKGITSITYNILGKPQQVNFSNYNVVNYTYDAAGTKLTVSSTVSGTTTTTNYVGGFVYNTSGTTNTLNFFSSPEGRVVKNGSAFEYQYAITDHQGNTRVLFTSAAPIVDSKTATFETANQAAEASNFSNYPSGAKINTLSTNAHSGSNSYYLNGGYNGQVGLAKSFSIMPGDVVSMQAYAKYNTPSGTATSYNSFVSSLLSAFNLGTPAPGETGTAASGVNSFGNWELGVSGDKSKSDVMKVFATIIIFDRNYNFIDVAYQAVTTSGGQLNVTYTAKQPGYAYLYISNEHPYQTDVYFDDVTMTYTPTNIIQSNEYYPFGLQTANSWTRNNTTNNFLANGGTELNTTSSLYDLDFRNYDPVLGRLIQIDPLSEKYAGLSPYNYAANSPVNINDPSGADLVYDEQNHRYAFRRQNPWENDGGGSAFDGSSYGTFNSPSFDYERDAWAVRHGQMSEEDYAHKHNENDDYRIVTNENGNVYLYHISDKSYDDNEPISWAIPLSNFGWWRASGFDIEAAEKLRNSPSSASGTDGFKSTNDVLNVLGFASGVKDVTIEGGVAMQRGMKIYNVNKFSLIRTISTTGAKYATLSKGLGTVGSIVTMGYSASKIYGQAESGGLNEVFRHRDILDFGVGAAGLTGAVLTTFGLVSNPVGWGIGIGVLVYGGATLIWDAATDH